MNPILENAIRTYSPIRAWYLATFRGKRVFTRICQPTLCVFGFVIYQQSWVLVSGDPPATVMNVV